jgi:hypothetical protein
MFHTLPSLIIPEEHTIITKMAFLWKLFTRFSSTGQDFNRLLGGMPRAVGG